MLEQRNKKIDCLNMANEIKFENMDSIQNINWDEDKDILRWINIQDKDFEKEIHILENKFNIHPLTMDDILNGTQRTKVEAYGDFVFMVLHLIEFEDEKKNLTVFNDLYIIAKDNVVVTITRTEKNIFNNLIDRIKSGNKKLYNSSNRLIFSIIYEIVEDYYNIFEIVEDKVDELDSELIYKSNFNIIDDLYSLRRNMIYMEKYITPIRIVAKYLKDKNEGEATEQSIFYYRDLIDSIENIIESIKVYKELTSSIIETVNNMVSDRTNDITKVLTIWSTIFLPITFLAGVFGMNFKYMNGLEWEFSYPLFWMISAVITFGMIYYFKKKKWF